MTQASNEVTTVLIVGGGLGGLALAQLLLQASSPSLKVMLFERDVDEDVRDQGYYITLKPIAGELKIIDRAVLRRNLLKNIDICWNKRFVSYTILDDGIEAYFHDGSSVKGTLLVGCDGAQSLVRAQLVPNLHREDTGVVIVAGTLELNEQCVQTRQLIQNSLVQILGDHGHALFLISVGQSWFWSLSWASTDTTQSNLSMPELLDKFRSNFNNEEIVRLMESSLLSTRLTPLRLYSLPRLRVNPFSNNPRVTLMGDAAHLMTIQRGMGANTTFADALDLVDVMRRGITPSLLGDYEEKMFKRGFQAVQDSFNNTRMIHLSGRQGMMRDYLLWCLRYTMTFKNLIWTAFSRG
ncbi:unnamed protein product [Rotaria sp. Silwood2]|nr:unnamed protein product [Rotaria sp. Silwood2]CAF3976828.1 unnamed protein product [Rotaria sp. Silwood2]